MYKYFTKQFIKPRINYGIAKIILSLETAKPIQHLYPMKLFANAKYLSTLPNPSIIKIASFKTEYNIQYLAHTETINLILNDVQTQTQRLNTIKNTNIKLFDTINNNIQHIIQQTKRLKHEHIYLKAEYERITITFDKLEYLYMVTHCTDIDIGTAFLRESKKLKNPNVWKNL